MDKSSLNNLLLGLSRLADDVPMGGKNYVEIAWDYYIERAFNMNIKDKFKPVSNNALDLCNAWIETMDKEGLLDKNNYQLSNRGESVDIQVDKQNCTYYEYCSTAKEEGLPLTCPRMLGFRWIVTNQGGRQYQLKIEDFVDAKPCSGTIYPGERIKQILSRHGDNLCVAGERAIVLSTHAFGILVKTIYDYAPHLLDRVLYESTYYSSLVEYEKVKSYFNNPRETVEHLLNVVQRLGNIRYEIAEFDNLNKRAVIKAYGSYMAEIFVNNELSTSPKTSCASGRGRLAAYFTKAWDEDMVCEEMKCEAFGDDYCEFILLPKYL